jgi:hypothetical protein
MLKTTTNTVYDFVEMGQVTALDGEDKRDVINFSD